MKPFQHLRVILFTLTHLMGFGYAVLLHFNGFQPETSVKWMMAGFGLLGWMFCPIPFKKA